MIYKQFLKLVLPCTNSQLASLCLNRQVHEIKFQDYDLINPDFKLDDPYSEKVLITRPEMIFRCVCWWC